APPRAAGTVRRRGIAGERTEAFLRVGARSARSGRWGWSRMVPRERSRPVSRRQPPSGRPPPPRERPRGAPRPLGRVADLLPQRRLLLRPPAPLPGARGVDRAEQHRLRPRSRPRTDRRAALGPLRGAAHVPL